MNILYKENDELKILKTEEFSYIFDKTNGTSYSWGKTKSDNPFYDPFSPEYVYVIIDNKFVFNEILFNKLLNLNLKTNQPINSNYFLSTISSIEIVLNDKNMLSSNELKKLINYLNNKKINVLIKIPYNNEFDLKDALKVKLLNINSLVFDINNIDFNFIDIAKILISNNIFLNCNIFINSKNLADFKAIIEQLPILLKISLILECKIDDNICDIFKIIKDTRRINFSVKNSIKNIGNSYEINYDEYDASLYSCVYDFITLTVYPDKNSFEKYSLSFNEINSINDFWLSKKFVKYRKSIIKKLKKV